MKKLMVSLVAATICGTMTHAAESAPWFVEVGPGVVIPTTKGADPAFGGQATAGFYLGQSDLGAFRLAATFGYYNNPGKNKDTLSKLVARMDNFNTIPLLGSVAYELNFSPVRFRFGPLVGVKIGSGGNTGLRTNTPRNLNSNEFAYGGLVGFAVDLTDSIYIAADYTYQGASNADTHLGVLSLGYRF